MPLYDFACPNCATRFEAPTGLAARRSNDARRAREHQRAERREQRRSQP